MDDPQPGPGEVLVADNRSWQEAARVPVYGQPVFVMAEPSGRRVWVNFAFPHNDTVQVIDVESTGDVRLRLINGSASTNFTIDLGANEGTLLSVDGNPVEPLKASLFPLATAQRADIQVRLLGDGRAVTVLARGEGRIEGHVLRVDDEEGGLAEGGHRRLGLRDVVGRPVACG